LEEKLQAFSPLQVLKRGYAIATKIDGTIIRDPGQVSSEETFQITVARGDFLARKEGGNGD
jgi:exodeoxyribonuclease VII large subunit